MRWEAAPAFEADLRRLSRAELEMFRKVVRERFVPAADRIAAETTARWPAALRVKAVVGSEGVWEMTWSFSGPDGRATFEWIQIDGERAILWRRIGDHRIFDDPRR